MRRTMPISKIKNIVILILLVANIMLLVLLIPLARQRQKQQAQPQGGPSLHPITGLILCRRPGFNR